MFFAGEAEVGKDANFCRWENANADCELLHEYYGKFAYLLLKCYSGSLSE